MKKRPKKEQPTNIIEWIDDMAEMSEEFFLMARGPMQDYTRFLTEKPTGKDKQAQDPGVKSNNQGVRFDNNAAGTSKANGKENKRHTSTPDIICDKCGEKGHIARQCTEPGKAAVNYPRSAAQQSDQGGEKSRGGGKRKGEKKGSVAAAVAAETTEDDHEEFQRFQEWKANQSKSTRRNLGRK